MSNQSPAVLPSRPQRVFISGASSGIGHALARYYAAKGATLGLVARREELLEALAAELNVPCAIYPLDVRDAKALQAAAQDFIECFGVPDIVIGNAGVSRGTLTEHAEDREAFKAVMEINVLGLVHTFQPFIQAMHAHGSGQLVGIASIAGIRGLPGAGRLQCFQGSSHQLSGKPASRNGENQYSCHHHSTRLYPHPDDRCKQL